MTLLTLLDSEHDLYVEPTADGKCNFYIGGRKLDEVAISQSGTEYTLIINNKPYVVDVKRVGTEEILVAYQNRQYVINTGRTGRMKSANRNGSGEKIVKSIMPGRILRIYVKPGDTVALQDRLLTLEAMKMENEVLSDIAGRVKAVFVTEGDVIEGNVPLIEFEL